LAVFSILKEYDALMINSMYLTILFIKNMKNPLPQAPKFWRELFAFYCFFQIKAEENSGQVIRFD